MQSQAMTETVASQDAKRTLPPPDTIHVPLWRGAVFLAVGLFLWRLWVYRGALIDDAYISLRYGRNWTDGLGFVFNAGERVEGYTNFLWVVLGGWLHRTPWDPMLGLRCVSLLGLGILLWSCLRAGSRLEDLAGGFEPVTVSVLGVTLLSVESLAYYATTGMETMLFAALSALAFYLACLERGHGNRRDDEDGARARARVRAWRRGSVLFFVLLALTRPEGVLLFALSHGTLMLADLLWRSRIGAAEMRRRWLRSVLDGGLFGLLYGVYFLWRWRYFGDLFPNTYYAKVTGGPEQWHNGWLALKAWGTSHPLFVVVLLVTPLLLWRHRVRPEIPWVGVLWGTTMGWAVYVVSIGGDFMPFFRFWLPTVAPLALLTVWCAWRLQGLRGRRSAVFLVLLVSQTLAGAWDEEDLRAYVAHRTTVVGQHVGQFFAETLPAESLMAVNTVGSLPYESRQPTLDMLGLTDKAIARHPIYVVSPRWAGHRRGWGAYVLSRKPQVVLWYNSAGSVDPHYLGDHQLADLPYFRFFYQAKQAVLPVPEGDDELWTFRGTPLGRSDGQPLWLAELGAEVTTDTSWWWERSRVRSADVRLHYFERRGDLDDLWAYAESPDLATFLGRVATHWQRRPAQIEVDSGAASAVQGLCQQALDAIQRGDRAAAKALLSQAIELNRKVQSPLPYQYVANLAYLDGSLFLAVQAQIEALRLDPQNRFYRRNLQALLERPWEGYRDEVASAAGDPALPTSGSPKQPASRQSL